MDSWHATFLGLRHLPREITAFEIEVFFRFSGAERQAMRWAADERRLAEACSAVLTFMQPSPDRRLLGPLGPRLLRHDEPGDGQARVAGTARSA